MSISFHTVVEANMHQPSENQLPNKSAPSNNHQQLPQLGLHQGLCTLSPHAFKLNFTWLPSYSHPSLIKWNLESARMQAQDILSDFFFLRVMVLGLLLEKKKKQKKTEGMSLELFWNLYGASKCTFHKL